VIWCDDDESPVAVFSSVAASREEHLAVGPASLNGLAKTIETKTGTFKTNWAEQAAAADRAGMTVFQGMPFATQM
jgi:hypothetical protein